MEIEMKGKAIAETDAATSGEGGAASGDESGGGAAASRSGGAAGRKDRVKGPWSPEEDSVLSRLVEQFGARNWSLIARSIAGRSGKSCRLRWCNQLDPAVKRKPFTGECAFSCFDDFT
ncbi:hypothetical protein Tsubulata_051234 [Turnera subulata]|uniref:Uncharacterized protein n=1 Tax=Turnera subulata TaxID=218843 RepID=A0A9Q0FB64_9ROSI|nr:hypothetical protein Tsubulata_051234 [Turnera subulata]